MNIMYTPPVVKGGNEKSTHHGKIVKNCCPQEIQRHSPALGTSPARV